MRWRRLKRHFSERATAEFVAHLFAVKREHLVDGNASTEQAALSLESLFQEGEREGADACDTRRIIGSLFEIEVPACATRVGTKIRLRSKAGRLDSLEELDSIVRNDDDARMTYPGGKGRMFQRIISMIPPHDTYIETHLGGGAVMRAKKAAKRSIGIEIDPDVAARWKATPGLEIVVGDAVEYLETFSFTGKEFVYCDPPYLASTRRRRRIYRHEYTTADHHRLLEVLKRLPCPVMLSGYPSKLYEDHLTGWRCVRNLERTQAGVAIECSWTNYDPPAVLHDHSHVGENFRQREAIRRKRARLVARIQSMPIQERGALVAELAGLEPELFAAALEATR